MSHVPLLGKQSRDANPIAVETTVRHSPNAMCNKTPPYHVMYNFLLHIASGHAACVVRGLRAGGCEVRELREVRKVREGRARTSPCSFYSVLNSPYSCDQKDE
jgi:hypothetical protein